MNSSYIGLTIANLAKDCRAGINIYKSKSHCWWYTPRLIDSANNLMWIYSCCGRSCSLWSCSRSDRRKYSLETIAWAFLRIRQEWAVHALSGWQVIVLHELKLFSLGVRNRKNVLQESRIRNSEPANNIGGEENANNIFISGAPFTNNNAVQRTLVHH